MTGLDPAGPLFVKISGEGVLSVFKEMIVAKDELEANRLDRASGELVDVIHTNGGNTPCAVPFTCNLSKIHLSIH